jgi:tetratricopeptide (TPR) repeat protein
LTIVCLLRVGQAFNEANRLGTLGFSLLQQLNATPWLARLSEVYYDSVFCWVRPFSASCLPLLEAYNVGLQSGDTEFALSCAMSAWFMKLEMEPLSESEHEIERLLERINLYGLKIFEHITLSSRHMIKDLLGCYDGDINELKRKIMDDNVYVFETNHLLLTWKYVHRALKLYLFGLYDEALSNARAGDSIAVAIYGPCRGSVVALICGLVDVAYARQMKHKRAPYAKKYSKLMHRWATVGEPRNFIGRHYLLEAEIAAMVGKKSKAYKLYVSAIGALREGKFLLHTAIATERIAKSLYEWGEYDLARPYFIDAVALYAKWGATKKMQHLELEIQQLGIYN